MVWSSIDSPFSRIRHGCLMIAVLWKSLRLWINSGRPMMALCVAFILFAIRRDTFAASSETSVVHTEVYSLRGIPAYPIRTARIDVTQMVARGEAKTAEDLPVSDQFAPPMTTNFEALGDDGTFIPPDTNGAVGPNCLGSA
jgi:hypothetical protein